jgi:hypothetical protein
MRSVPFRASTDCDLDVCARTGWLGDRPCVRITLSNPRDDEVDGWNVLITAPGNLTGIIDAKCCAVAMSEFHVTGDGCTRVIPPRGAVTFGMLFD